MSTYSVDEVFIKEAHKAACPDWKRKLEEKFPDIFRITVEDIQKLTECKLYLNQSIHMSGSLRIHSNGLIEIRLPTANSAWTFAAWDLAKAICAKWSEYYPVHRGKYDHDIIVLEHN